jgi:ATP-dependent Clp protease ATP-binding subunit ClpA
MLERLTGPAREVVVRARDEALATGAAQIGTEHLLLALLDPDSVIAYPLLAAAGLEHDPVRAELARLTGPPPGALTDEDAQALRAIGIDLDAVLARIVETFGPDALGPPGATPPTSRWRRAGSARRFTPRARRSMGVAVREAIRLGDRQIDDGCILAGILRADGRAVQLMKTRGVPAKQLLAALEQSRRRAA